jgi:glycolate oxidase FAD binding subunit
MDFGALCSSIRERVATGYAIYPQGGRTALELGDIPARPGVAVDTTGLNQLVDYPAADMTITVQAGMTLAALSAILAEKHQRVLIDAPDRDRATLGGIYATNTCGSRRYGAGRPRDQIIGVSFATSAGEIVKGGGRVVKNVAGYDFPKLLTGSMGTLGIITQVTLKVRPIPEASALAWITLDATATLASSLDGLNTSGTRPIAIDVLNQAAARSVGQSAGLPAAASVLVVGFEDNANSVQWQLDQLRQELGSASTGLSVIKGADAAPVWTALTQFQVIDDGRFTIVANLRPSYVVTFIEKLDPGRWSVQAHAGNGIVRAHAIGEWDLESAASDVTELRRLAVENGGNLMVSRCATDWKERLKVWGQPRADWAIAERIKDALDPVHAMNPGRFVGRI